MKLVELNPTVTGYKIIQNKDGQDVKYMKLTLTIEEQTFTIAGIRVMPSKQGGDDKYVAWPGYPGPGGKGFHSYIEFTQYSTLRTKFNDLVLEAAKDY